MPTLINDALFAPLDADLHLERIAGGNETEVYCTDDRCYVVKVKSDGGGEPDHALVRAHAMRRAADNFAAVIGAQHSIPNSFIVATNSQGQAQPVIIQPYYQHASPLFTLDYSHLHHARAPATGKSTPAHHAAHDRVLYRAGLDA